MAPRATVTPIALAILALLREKPMHPYGMAHEMRLRGQADSVRLSSGSLYHAVDSLERRGLIQPQTMQRDGRRPERTVYAGTEAGRQELRRSLSGMLRSPDTDLSHFAGALSWLELLDPPDALEALRERAEKLHQRLSAILEEGRPHAASLERQYRMHMIHAEHEWVTGLVQRLTT